MGTPLNGSFKTGAGKISNLHLLFPFILHSKCILWLFLLWITEKKVKGNYEFMFSILCLGICFFMDTSLSTPVCTHIKIARIWNLMISKNLHNSFIGSMNGLRQIEKYSAPCGNIANFLLMKPSFAFAYPRSRFPSRLCSS